MNTRERFQATTAAEMSQVLLAVRTCPDRGSVLPHSVQPECGCAELTACRAGLGRAGAGAGAVSLEDIEAGLRLTLHFLRRDLLEPRGLESVFSARDIFAREARRARGKV